MAKGAVPALIGALEDNGKRMGQDWMGEGGIEPGDLVINEIQWYGVNDLDIDGNDEFIELRNTSNRDRARSKPLAAATFSCRLPAEKYFVRLSVTLAMISFSAKESSCLRMIARTPSLHPQ